MTNIQRVRLAPVISQAVVVASSLHFPVAKKCDSRMVSCATQRAVIMFMYSNRVTTSGIFSRNAHPLSWRNETTSHHQHKFCRSASTVAQQDVRAQSREREREGCVERERESASTCLKAILLLKPQMVHSWAVCRSSRFKAQTSTHQHIMSLCTPGMGSISAPGLPQEGHVHP